LLADHAPQYARLTLADLYPQWLVRDLLPLPPTGGIPREGNKIAQPAILR
jgi:hypothetical protein